MGDTFGDKFKKAFKLGGSSKDTGDESPVAHSAHGASTGAKVRCNPAELQLVLQLLVRDALAQKSRRCEIFRGPEW